jgi:uncharacterized protein YegP (UPF0339 family)
MLTIEVYKGKRAGWYWRLKASNGRVIADGAEAYATRSNVNRAALRIARELNRSMTCVRAEAEQRLME